MDSSSAQVRRVKEDADQNSNDTAKVYNKNLQKTEKDYEEELKRTRDDAARRIEEERTAARGEVDRLKQQMYDNHGKKFARDSRDFNEEKHQLEKFRDDLQSDFNHRMNQEDHNQAELIEKMRKDSQADSEKALSAQRQSMEGELRRANRELREHRAFESKKNSEIAAARQNAIHEVEGSSNWKVDQLERGFEAETARENAKKQQDLDYYNSRMAEKTDEDNRRSTDMLLAQRHEFAAREHELMRQNQELKDKFAQAINSEKNKNLHSQAQMFTQGKENASLALEQQKKAYMKDWTTREAMVDATLADKSARIQYLENPVDGREVPEPAREAIENKVVNNYEKRLAYERDRNQMDRMAIYSQSVKDRIMTKEEADRTVRNARRNATALADSEKTRLMASYNDLESEKDSEITKIRTTAHEQLDLNDRAHSEELMELTNHLNDAVDEHRFVQENKTRRVLDDSEFREHAMTRDFNLRLNAARREFDKKMLDQKQDYDAKLRDAMEERNHALHELSRNANALLEDRVRMYEHQIAQMEQTQKERERFLTEHYEDELARMSKTNAQLIQQKKG